MLFKGGNLLLICNVAEFPVISLEILLIACNEYKISGNELFFLINPTGLDGFSSFLRLWVAKLDVKFLCYDLLIILC